jgi:hypothetical protein
MLATLLSSGAIALSPPPPHVVEVTEAQARSLGFSLRCSDYTATVEYPPSIQGSGLAASTTVANPGGVISGNYFGSTIPSLTTSLGPKLLGGDRGL